MPCLHNPFRTFYPMLKGGGKPSPFPQTKYIFQRIDDILMIMDEIIAAQPIDIKGLILTVRDVQILLDSDVAMLYGFETRVINQTATRNKARFPEDFRFQLTRDELESVETLRSQNVISKVAYDESFLRLQKSTSKIANTEQTLRSQNVISKGPDVMRSQNATSNVESRGGRRYLPYVYTEQGIAMLSGLLKNDIAIKVSIGIMQAFVEMRRTIAVYGHTFERLTNVEYKLLEHDKRFDELFDQIQTSKEFHQGVFYKGQIYDAFKLFMDIIRSADTSIIVIDNYADDSVLDMLTCKKNGVAVTIVSNKPSRISQLALGKFTAQYTGLQIITSPDFHDRFIIIDDKKLYHVGASLKDAGKKCFAISLIEDEEYLKLVKSNALKGIV